MMASMAAVDDILGEANDLLKLLTVVNESEVSFEDINDCKDFVVKEVVKQFNDFGEVALDLCLEIALDYGFIAEETDPKRPALKRFVVKDRQHLDVSHDWFCFNCDKLVDKRIQLFLKCGHCLRIFHRKCENSVSIDDFVCSLCQKKRERERHPTLGTHMLDTERVNKLIAFIIDYMKSIFNEKAFESFVFAWTPIQSLIVWRPMDLQLIRDQIIRRQYQSVHQFEEDFALFLHNFMSLSLKTTQSIVDLKFYFDRELTELSHCVDCFERSNEKSKDKDWFCRPCRPPHEVVFAKQKNFAPFPAKVIYRHSDGKKVNVRYFDNENNRADINAEDIYDINDKKIKREVRDKRQLIKPMESLKRFLKFEEMEKRLQKSEQWVRTHHSSHSTGTVDLDTGFVADNNESNDLEAVVKAREEVSAIELLQKDSEIPVQHLRSSLSKQMSTSADQQLSDSDTEDEETIEEISNRSDELKEFEDDLDMECEDYESRDDNTCEDDEVMSAEEDITDITAGAERTEQSSLSTGTVVSEETDTEEDDSLIDAEMDSSDTHCASELAETQNTLKLDEINDDFANNNVYETPPSMINVIPVEPQMGNNSKAIETEVKDMSIKVTVNTPSVEDNDNCNDFEIIFENMSKTIDSPKPQSRPESLNGSSATESESGVDCQSLSSVKVNDSSNQSSERKDKSDDKSKEYHKLFDEKYNKLMDRTTEEDYREALMVMNLCYERLYKELLSVTKELQKSKIKNWCAVCHQKATFYCCFRRYCSTKCQASDWADGHSRQCSLASKQN